MDTSADRTRARQIEAEPEGEHVRVYAPEGKDPNQERPGGQQPPFPPRAGFLKKRWEQKDKQGVQCYNCQKYSVTTPPMVGSTWLRVRSTLESDCLPVLFQGTASFRLAVD